MLRIGPTVLVMLCIFFGSVQMTLAEKVVKLVTLEWPPYSGENMPDQGVLSDVIRTAYERKGYETRIFFMDWTRAQKLVQEGKYDGATCMYKTKTRVKIYNFSEPIMDTIMGFFKKKGKKITFRELEDLKSYRIGVTRGYANTVEFDAATFLNKIQADSDITNLRRLLFDYIDLCINDKYVGRSLIMEIMPEHIDEFEFVKPALERNILYIGFTKDKAGVSKKRRVFNEALQEIKSDGTFKKILTKHGIK